jgi:hypothetical protein
MQVASLLFVVIIVFVLFILGLLVVATLFAVSLGILIALTMCQTQPRSTGETSLGGFPGDGLRDQAGPIRRSEVGLGPRPR